MFKKNTLMKNCEVRECRLSEADKVRKGDTIIINGRTAAVKTVDLFGFDTSLGRVMAEDCGKTWERG